MPDADHDGSPRIITRKRQPQSGLCLVVDNGEPCPRQAQTRGLCGQHYQMLRARGDLTRYAAAPVDRRHVFARKPPAQQQDGVCAVIVNGTACTAAAERRGLCRRHYVAIWQRPDLTVDTFAVDAPQRRVTLRRPVVPGVCRVREDGTPCTASPHARGLCKRHYRWLRDRPALFDRLAEPDPGAPRYTRRHRPPAGRCRVAENGAGCPAPAETRGLCRRHYAILARRPELMAAIALPASRRTRRVLERLAHPLPDTCVVRENGVACTQPVWKRGLCRRHHRVIGDSSEHSLYDFYLPEANDPPEECAAWSIVSAGHDGRCRIADADGACRRDAYRRGLCRKHYRFAQKHGLLEAMGLPPRDRGARASQPPPQPLPPHVWLDKNILFDHADRVVFGARARADSVTLVDAVCAGRVRASVTADAVKTVYNHVRHRAARAPAAGGQAADPAAAEAQARAYLQQVFVDPPRHAWRLEAWDPCAMLVPLTAAQQMLSLEDAWEWQAYQRARQRSDGPVVFLTWDSDFPAGVTPAAWAAAVHDAERAP